MRVCCAICVNIYSVCLSICSVYLCMCNVNYVRVLCVSCALCFCVCMYSVCMCVHCASLCMCVSVYSLCVYDICVYCLNVCTLCVKVYNFQLFGITNCELRYFCDTKTLDLELKASIPIPHFAIPSYRTEPQRISFDMDGVTLVIGREMWMILTKWIKL